MEIVVAVVVEVVVVVVMTIYMAYVYVIQAGQWHVSIFIQKYLHCFEPKLSLLGCRIF